MYSKWFYKYILTVLSVSNGTVGSSVQKAGMFSEWAFFISSLTSHLWDCNWFSHLQPPFQHNSNPQLVLNSLSSDSAAAFIHHFSVLQIHAIILLTDNQSCVSVCLANSSSFHVNFPCWILDQQTHYPVHILLEHHHKIIHLTICADDTGYQLKHSIVKFCGPKCFMVVEHWMYCFYFTLIFLLSANSVILQLFFFPFPLLILLVIFILFVFFLWYKNSFIFFTHLCTSYCTNSGTMFDCLGVGDKQDYRFYMWQQFGIAHYIFEYQQ